MLAEPHVYEKQHFAASRLVNNFFLMKNMAKSLVFFSQKNNTVNWFHSYYSREHEQYCFFKKLV